jgi:hypothetical protein
MTGLNAWCVLKEQPMRTSCLSPISEAVIFIVLTTLCQKEMASALSFCGHIKRAMLIWLLPISGNFARKYLRA